MCNEPTFIANLQLAELVRTLPGPIVECGVWRGGMIAAIASMLGPDREYVLFDSFEGLPPAQTVDGVAAIRWQASDPDNCRAPISHARDAMNDAGCAADIRAGWFYQTLPEFKAREPIALLRLDADWYAGTMECLGLFDLVADGGLIIVDDYYVWDGCARALHDFLSRRSARERIREHAGVCHIIKGH